MFIQKSTVFQCHVLSNCQHDRVTMATLLTPVRHALSMLPSKMSYIKMFSMIIGMSGLEVVSLSFQLEDLFFIAGLCYRSCQFAECVSPRCGWQTRAACSGRDAPLPSVPDCPPDDTASIKPWRDGRLSIPLYVDVYIVHKFLKEICHKSLSSKQIYKQL